jgi:hypothetical protein
MDTAGCDGGNHHCRGRSLLAQKNSLELTKASFQTVVVISLLPALLAVLSWRWERKTSPSKGSALRRSFRYKGWGNLFLFSW